MTREERRRAQLVVEAQRKLFRKREEAKLQARRDAKRRADKKARRGY